MPIVRKLALILLMISSSSAYAQTLSGGITPSSGTYDYGSSVSLKISLKDSGAAPPYQISGECNATNSTNATANFSFFYTTGFVTNPDMSTSQAVTYSVPGPLAAGTYGVSCDVYPPGVGESPDYSSYTFSNTFIVSGHCTGATIDLQTVGDDGYYETTYMFSVIIQPNPPNGETNAYDYGYYEQANFSGYYDCDGNEIDLANQAPEAAMLSASLSGTNEYSAVYLIYSAHWQYDYCTTGTCPNSTNHITYPYPVYSQQTNSPGYVTAYCTV